MSQDWGVEAPERPNPIATWAKVLAVIGGGVLCASSTAAAGIAIIVLIGFFLASPARAWWP